MDEDFKLFNLQVELNDVCNLECKHCYQVREKDKEELDIDLILEQVEELKKITGYDNHIFRLSGGEVTLRRDLFQIIRKIVDKGYFTEVISNGVLIDTAYAFALKSSGVHMCQISMDGSNANVHDFIRGQGSYDKTIKGIKSILKANIPLELKFTLIKGVNIDDIYNMFSLCSQLGIKNISIGRFIFAGNGLENLKAGNLIGREMEEVFFRIIEAGSEFPDLGIRVRDQLAKIVPLVSNIKIPENIVMNQKPYMGINYLALDTYGNVYADRQLDVVIGNIHEKSLVDIWTKSKKLKQLKGDKKYLRGKCISCHINEICMGGNKTAVYGLTGNFFDPDPGCWI
jgi:radical SAM protein with 4Fe4S-binding SPASM domain